MLNIISGIVSIDKAVFSTLNCWRAPFFDMIMPIFSDEDVLIIIAIPLALWRLFKGDKKERYMILSLIIGIIITDALCYHILKPIIGRPRPFFTMAQTYIYKGGQFKLITGQYALNTVRHTLSFPSCHAANTAFIASYLCGFYRKMPICLSVFSIILLVGYSRIYLGAHYPLDVIGGYVVGILIAWLMLCLFNGWKRLVVSNLLTNIKR